MQDNPTTSQTKAEHFIELQKAKSVPVDECLRSCLDFMKGCLAQAGNPDFKGFWQVRQYCFPLFKEGLSKHLRTHLWELYTELTREGRRLKSLLDVESSFAAEQISLAIEDMETQVEVLLKEGPDAVPNEFKIPKLPQALRQEHDLYFDKQRRLHLFNLFAARIHALRKELIKTQMRMKQKNGLFSRLSALGDLVFPQRKQLMKEVNEEFVSDVRQFADAHFSEKNFCPEKVRRQVFFFRDEIKLFQTLAKALTLDTHSFAETRVTLSQCWDRLKGMEKELKKEFSEQKQQSAENTEVFKAKVEEMTTLFNQGELTMDGALAKLEELGRQMREVVLVRSDVQMLKEKMSELNKVIQDKKQEQRKVKQNQEAAQETKRKEEIAAFEQRATHFVEELAQGGIQERLDQLALLRQEFRGLLCHSAEKGRIEAIFKQAKDRLMERQELALLELPLESRQLLDHLSNLLRERKERRAEIKGQLDEYRKILAGSSLDIERAMSTQELVQLEKEALERCDASIIEIEKKIKDIKL